MHFFITALFGLLVTACNSVFYQPSTELYSTPEQFGFEYSESFTPTSDGEQLAVWEISHSTTPAHTDILHFHGNAENMSTHFLFVAWLTNLGFRVTVFDYRGYGSSTGTPTRAGVYNDALSMVMRAEKMGRPYLLIAQSLGGSILGPALTKIQTKLLRGVLLDSSFYSYRELAQEKLGSFFLTWPVQIPLSYLISDELSPKHMAVPLEVPLLFTHGTKDHIVSYEQGLKYFNAIKNDRSLLHSIPGGRHTQALAFPFGKHQEFVANWLCQQSENQTECQKNLKGFKGKIKAQQNINQ